MVVVTIVRPERICRGSLALVQGNARRWVPHVTDRRRNLESVRPCLLVGLAIKSLAFNSALRLYEVPAGRCRHRWLSFFSNHGVLYGHHLWVHITGQQARYSAVLAAAWNPAQHYNQLNPTGRSGDGSAEIPAPLPVREGGDVACRDPCDFQGWLSSAMSLRFSRWDFILLPTRGGCLMRH